MELFEKWYNCYYQVVRQILAEASDKPVSKNRMNELSMQYGFLESGLSIIPKLTGGHWPLLQKESTLSTSSASPAPGYRSVLHHREPLLPGTLPLTTLQKSWLKALLSDPRIGLFLSEEEQNRIQTWLADIEPLFHQEDFYYFDQYRDGDDYLSPAYREHFRTILSALDRQAALAIDYENQRKHATAFTVLPCQLQYSSKDDKFRLCCLQQSRQGWGRNLMLNLGRIKDCRILLPEQHSPAPASALRFHLTRPAKEPVVIQISGERNSLERCMLHFANYEKHTLYDEEQKVWISSIYYDLADETELLIEILSFGPVIRVLGPESFLALVRQRVKRQHDLFYSRQL